MNARRIIKVSVDIVMTILLIALMSFMLTGQRLHEWLGVMMALLFIIHHVLNLGWMKNLFKGKYTSSRIFCTVLNGLLFVDIIALLISGIVISGFVFPALSIHSGIASARRLHITTVYWGGVILLSAHLGCHWGMITGMAGKAFHVKPGDKKRTILFRLISVLVSAYGIYALYVHRVYEYLILKNIFVFWDYERPAWQVIFDYTAMLYLFAAIAYYIKTFLGCKAWQSKDFPVDYMCRKK